MYLPRILRNRLLSAALVLSVLPMPAHAVLITLSSTGVDANGNLLPGGSTDPHYTVTGPGVTGTANAVVYSSSNIWSQWSPNDAHSGWIGFRDSFSSSPHGTYTYTLSFNLTGYDVSTAVLSGAWAADQFGSISLNGISTGLSVGDGNWNAGSFPNLTAFTINSGFQNGLNTLSFVISEPDDGDGLLVRNLSLSATAVPEPPIGCLVLAGSMVSAFAIRRRHGVPGSHSKPPQ